MDQGALSALGAAGLLCPCFPEQSSWAVLTADTADLTAVLTSSPLPQQNLNGVMVAVAELLSMKIPNSYEVLFPDGPARASLEPKKGEAEGSGK